MYRWKRLKLTFYVGSSSFNFKISSSGFLSICLTLFDLSLGILKYKRTINYMVKKPHGVLKTTGA